MKSVIAGVRSQWNLANSLTAIRACAILIAMPLLYFRQEELLFLLVILACLSDAEGYLARLTNTTTHLGRVLDPLADKLFTNTMLIGCIFAYGGVLMTLVLLICNLAYDIDNSYRRIRDIMNGLRDRAPVDDSTPTTLLSKSKTCALYGLVIVLYLPFEWALDEEFISNLSLMTLILVLTAWWCNRRDLFFALLR